MPHVVFDRMVDPKEVPEYDRKAMNARKMAQACVTVYLGLDASAEEIGLKGYDTFMREDPNNRNQYASSANIETHKDITVTVPTPKSRCHRFREVSMSRTRYRRISSSLMFRSPTEINSRSSERL